MRSWLALAAVVAGCGGKPVVAPHDDACGDGLARAKVDARQGRVLHANARLRALGACFDAKARAYADELIASLGIDALIAKRDVHDPSADAAAARGEDELAHARELRDAPGALDTGDAIDAAYAQAAAAYEQAVAIAPRLDWLVAIAELWREADDRVEANRAASRAAAFAMAIAGVDHLTPELVPVRVEDPEAFALYPLGDEPSSVQDLAWSADGAVLFAGAYGDVQRAWQPGREVRGTMTDDLATELGIALAPPRALEIVDGAVHVGAATIAPAEQPTAAEQGAAGIVVGGGWRDDAGRVRLYDETGAMRWETDATGDPVFTIATDPDGRRIAVGTRHGVIRIYDRDGHARGALIAGNGIPVEGAPTTIFRDPQLHLALDWAVVDPDGHVDGSPDGSRFVQWRAGDQIVPGFIGWDAQLQPGLLAQVLAR